MRPSRTVPLAALVTASSLLLSSCASAPSPTRLDAAAASSTVSVSPRTVTVDVSLVAAVVELPSTIGVADSTLYALSAQDLDKQLQLLKDAGVTDLRIAVPWVYIQPTSSTEYDWSKMDAVINTATDMGFSITASVTGNPAWDGVPIAGAPNPDAYASFVGETAARYAGKISAYEVWNEPNGVLFYAPVSPESYTEVLKSAYTAIKASDPDAIVVGGVLGAVQTVPGVTLNPVDFLDRMYQSGAAGYFDALSYHPYHYTLPFSQGLGETNSPMEQVLALRALMAANGDADLKIWATEYGNPTTPFFGLTQEQHAAFMADFISAWQNVEGAGPAFLYSGHDLETGSWDSEANFGLWTSNWTPKVAVDVLAAMLEDLEDGTLDNPQYAQRLPFQQVLFIQVASTVLGLVNTALIIPRAIVQTLRGLAEQVVTAIRNVVSPPKAATEPEPESTVTDSDTSAREDRAVVAVSDTREAAANPAQEKGATETDAAVSVASVERDHKDTTSEGEEKAASTDEGRDTGTESPASLATADADTPAVNTVSEDDTSAPSAVSDQDEAPTNESVTEAPATTDKKAEREAKREAKKAAQEAKKAEREAKRAERQEAREAKKAEREAQREAKKAERSAAESDSAPKDSGSKGDSGKSDSSSSE